jgi:hypothetical protein
MPDAREVIAATLRQHPQADEWGYPVEECRCGAWFNGDYAEHVADVLLGLSGVAITQLPEPNPNGVRRHPSWRVIVDGEPEDVYVRREQNEPEIEVVVSGVTSLTSGETHALAAALLAAAREADHHA